MDWLVYFRALLLNYAEYPLYSLELNIHQQILSDIASSVSETKDDLIYAKELISSKVTTKEDLQENYEDEEYDDARVFMVRQNTCDTLTWTEQL